MPVVVAGVAVQNRLALLPGVPEAAEGNIGSVHYQRCRWYVQMVAVERQVLT